MTGPENSSVFPASPAADYRRFMMRYEFALKEVGTRLEILREEFETIHEHSPIEHIVRRRKTWESITRKARRRGFDLALDSIRDNVRDIAGVRVTCPFISDLYRVAGMLVQQPDLVVTEYKDYVEDPKPSGYRSLHLIMIVPVYLSDKVEHVPVEVQVRTIAMDFWASLEHTIYYKYDGHVPEHLREGLLEAAHDADRLDRKMGAIHQEMRALKVTGPDED